MKDFLAIKERELLFARDNNLKTLEAVIISGIEIVKKNFLTIDKTNIQLTLF